LIPWLRLTFTFTFSPPTQTATPATLQPCHPDLSYNKPAMPSQSNIKVQILVDGQSLQEHTGPDGGCDNDHIAVRFAEAKVGQRFKVKITLLLGFHFKSTDYVVVTLCVDLDRRGNHGTIQSWNVENYKRQVTKPKTTYFETIKLKD
jgi:hypothetical protein